MVYCLSVEDVVKSENGDEDSSVLKGIVGPVVKKSRSISRRRVNTKLFQTTLNMVGGEPGSVPVKKARSVTPRRKNVTLAVFQNILSGCGGTSASMDGGGVESCC